MSARSRSRTASKARRRWATKWPSSSAGRCRTRFSIPAGGGVGLIGMWKAFDEMETLGWISSKRPKMIAVQAEGCQPVVRAFERGESKSQFWENAHTVAAGLRVPKPLGDALMLDAIRKSGGTAIAVSDEDLLDAASNSARTKEFSPRPKAAPAWRL